MAGAGRVERGGGREGPGRERGTSRAAAPRARGQAAPSGDGVGIICYMSVCRGSWSMGTGGGIWGPGGGYESPQHRWILSIRAILLWITYPVFPAAGCDCNSLFIPSHRIHDGLGVWGWLGFFCDNQENFLQIPTLHPQGKVQSSTTRPLERELCAEFSLFLPSKKTPSPEAPSILRQKKTNPIIMLRICCFIESFVPSLSSLSIPLHSRLS